MKIAAIAGRGTRRDFVDLYSVAQSYGLSALLELFRDKFREANYSMIHVMKSLVWFEDAEKDPLPRLLHPLTWEEITAYFRGHVPVL